MNSGCVNAGAIGRRSPRPRGSGRPDCHQWRGAIASTHKDALPKLGPRCRRHVWRRGALAVVKAEPGVRQGRVSDFVRTCWQPRNIDIPRDTATAGRQTRLAVLRATTPRGDRLPKRVVAAVLLILRGGGPGYPEVTRSHQRYHYQHRVKIEAVKQGASQDATFDIRRGLRQHRRGVWRRGRYRRTQINPFDDRA